MQPSLIQEQISPAEALAVSFAPLFAKMAPAEVSKLAKLSDEQVIALAWDWRGMWARPEQLLPPGEWRTWLLLAGRGFGKTRSGAEAVNEWGETRYPGVIGIIAPTSGDARDVCVEGPSGIIACGKPWFMPRFEPSKRRITWPNGQRCQVYSADEPDRIRGANLSKMWADELCAWPVSRENGQIEAWNMAQFALRVGDNTQGIVTTTPKPIKQIIDLSNDEATKVTRGSTLANFRNLDPAYLRTVMALYKGTRLGRQEIFAEFLLDSGNLFNPSDFYAAMLPELPKDLDRIVVAVDPAPTSNEGSDFTGIHVAGVKTIDGVEHVYCLADPTCKGTPDKWGNATISAFHKWGADRVVGEVNVGGEMVGSLLHTIDPNLPFREVRAGRGAGKGKRAEPVAALVEQGRVHLCGDREQWEKFIAQAHVFSGLNGKRDDRVDAFLWAVHELVLTRDLIQLI